jgi:hypothetical protein
MRAVGGGDGQEAEHFLVRFKSDDGLHVLLILESERIVERVDVLLV